MTPQILLWGGFSIFVLVMLALDLVVFHRKSETVEVKDALRWSGVWIGLALVFNLGLYFWYSAEGAMAFLTGYVLEKSLSVDNLFVFLMLFAYFSVPAAYQHKVLFWGILGALVMRALMIAVGTALIQQFHWVLYVFGGFLIFTGLKMLKHQEQTNPGNNPLVRVFTRFMPVTSTYHADRFFVVVNGRYAATPLFLVLLVVEATDVVFALDSIPAVLAVTTDPFVVFTSNVFAIMGLRSLFFALAGMMDLFHYLRYGLAAVLSFIGAKMLLSDVIHLPIYIALAVVLGVLGLSILVSLLFPVAPAAAAPDVAELSPEA